LSIYAKAEKTIIEGVVYYDGKKISSKGSNRKERNELIGQLLEKNKGANTQEPKKKREERIPL
jgi:hypothetical protein